ncbi:hypothetical protein [Streptomyces sp. NPDC020965]|uniref:hypothetical protein n=1 Tax=Streptomyces sp. NPDC020965 TaxID=3365105 RepID=UPI00379AA947
MRIHHHVAAVVASLALAGTGLIGMASSANAASPAPASRTSAAPAAVAALSCERPVYRTGSGGHHGASIRCFGGSFTGFVDCHKPGHPVYRHYGNRAGSGGTSTTWCDLGARVVAAGAVNS